ncbi:hypothetical protein ACS0TY_024692 [Phlomoides rotata]
MSYIALPLLLDLDYLQYQMQKLELLEQAHFYGQSQAALRLPSAMKMVFHPIICCALSSELAAFAYGKLSNFGLIPVLGFYLTKVSSNPALVIFLWGFLDQLFSHLPSQCSNKER